MGSLDASSASAEESLVGLEGNKADAREESFVYHPLPGQGFNAQEEHFSRSLHEFCQRVGPPTRVKQAYLRKRFHKHAQDAPATRVSRKPPQSMVEVLNETAPSRLRDTSHMPRPALGRCLIREKLKGKCPTNMEEAKEMRMDELKDKYKSLFRVDPAFVDLKDAEEKKPSGSRTQGKPPDIYHWPWKAGEALPKTLVLEPTRTARGPARERLEGRLRREARDKQIRSRPITSSGVRDKEALVHGTERLGVVALGGLLDDTTLWDKAEGAGSTIRDIMQAKRTEQLERAAQFALEASLTQHQRRKWYGAGDTEQKTAVGMGGEMAEGGKKLEDIAVGTLLGVLPLGASADIDSVAQSSLSGGTVDVGLHESVKDDDTLLAHREGRPDHAPKKGGSVPLENAAASLHQLWKAKSSMRLTKAEATQSTVPKKSLKGGWKTMKSTMAVAKQMTVAVAQKGITAPQRTIMRFDREHRLVSQEEFVMGAAQGDVKLCAQALAQPESCEVNEQHEGIGQTPFYAAVLRLLELDDEERSRNTRRRLASFQTPAEEDEENKARKEYEKQRASCNATIELLLSHGANVNSGQGHPTNPCYEQNLLHRTATSGNVAVLLWLLKKGVKVDTKDAKGVTPLMVAARKGHVREMVALLAANADVEAVDKLGRTPLHFAAKGGAKGVRVLLMVGSSRDARDVNFATPEDIAIKRGRISTLDTLMLYRGKRLPVSTFLDFIDLDKAGKT